MHIPIVDVIDSGINIMEGDELNELTLKVKQQILFTLIKQVTKWEDLFKTGRLKEALHKSIGP
jgi:hypothetical protein